MQGAGIVIGGILLILFLSLQADEGGFFQSDMSLESVGTTTEERIRRSDETISSEPQQRISNREAEEEIQRLYRELDTLNEEVRALKLREPASPHRDMVTLQIAGARSTDPDREYLILRADRSNTEPVNISNWYLESYVSGRAAAIPQGARLLESFRSRRAADIELLPGEQAYLLTREPPLNVSFHENACSGYLREEGDFYPYLRSRCPYPNDEIADSNIKLDDDTCYDFVDRLRTCEYVSEDDIDEIDDLTGRCERFLENTFNYNGCVDLHKNDPLFDTVGDWRVYLDRRRELWRDEREIIRLMDEQDRVITVVEY